MQNLPEALRRDQIVKNGLALVKREGFAAITCRTVAKESGCSYRTVARLFKNRSVLSRAIVQYAGTVKDRWVIKEAQRLGI